MFLLRLAMRPWKIAPWSQLISGVVVGFLVLLSGVMVWLESGLRPVVRRLQSEQVITAYLKTDLEPSAEGAVFERAVELVGIRLADLSEQQRTQAQKDLSVESRIEGGWVKVQLLRTQSFTQELKENFPDLASQLEGLSAEEVPLIVPRALSIQGVFPEENSELLMSEVEKLPGVETAENSRDRYSSLVGAFRALRGLTGFLIIGLLLTTFTGLVHLGRLNAHLHQDALTVIRLWGAGPTLLRTPAMLSGLSVGFLGGMLALTGWLLSGQRLADTLRSLSPVLRDLASPDIGWVGVSLVLVACGIGWLAGLFGSFGVQDQRGTTG